MPGIGLDGSVLLLMESFAVVELWVERAGHAVREQLDVSNSRIKAARAAADKEPGADNLCCDSQWAERVRRVT